MFDSIDLLTGKVFQVTWDLGRRCNYDCSYCPSHRHDNFSSHATLESLCSNVDFLLQYIDVYMSRRNFKEASITFTGGEPTVNPNFIQLVEYIKSEYVTKYQSKWACNFAVTSNGAMSKSIADAIIKHMGHITISYHVEADQLVKDKVLTRVRQFNIAKKNQGFGLSLNVMFHAEYFNECIRICEQLEKEGIAFVPRVIGEELDSKPTFAHMYTAQQSKWMKLYWENDKDRGTPEHKSIKQITEDAFSYIPPKTSESLSKDKLLGVKIGRPCCGSREMKFYKGVDEKIGRFSEMREFKGWYCSVNWFFLHLEQQTDSLFHHQTCQARFDNTRGPIGKLSDGQSIVDNLRKMIETDTLPTIVCTKQTCGCGLCSPKSTTLEKYKTILMTHQS